MRLSVSYLLATLVATVSAKRIISKGKAASVKASSRAGRKLLAKARRLDEAEADYSWMPEYTFQFQKCYSWEAYGREDNNENMEKSIIFRACPQGECSSTCSYGADYIVQLADYVDAYITAKQNLREYNCQMVEENCECDDDQVDDDACMYNCYAAAGLNYCNDDENQFDPMDYVDCAQLEMNNDNNNRKLDEENAIYGGLYCSDDGDSVLMGAFTDEDCSTFDSSNTYYKTMGSALPYSSKSIVGSGCVSCANPFYVEGDDDNQEDNVNEMCMEVYDMAGKCETDLNINYPTTDACIYINNVVPNLAKLYKGEDVDSSGSSALTWFFGFTTLALAGFIGYNSYNKKSASIDLAEQGGVMT